jgi:hypothetical protein
MNQFDATVYGPELAPLLTGSRLPALGPGLPNEGARSALAALVPDTIIPGHRDLGMALACISGLWLLHDFLDESHTISQDLDTPTGSFWHAIMHRREPDASNSKYWWRLVGAHPVLKLLAAEFGSWDPFAFVDRCEGCRGAGGDEEMECRRLQLREWQVLFNWCYDEAK